MIPGQDLDSPDTNVKTKSVGIYVIRTNATKYKIHNSIVNYSIS